MESKAETPRRTALAQIESYEEVLNWVASACTPIKLACFFVDSYLANHLA
jgi:hypothetical protein